MMNCNTQRWFRLRQARSLRQFASPRMPIAGVAGLRVVLLLSLLVVSPLALSSDAQAEDQHRHQPASEILADGLDAMEEGSDSLARETFAYLIKKYPYSDEAKQAREEMAKLGVFAEDDDGDWSTTWAADTSRIDEMRRYFVRDVGDRVFFAQSSADLGGRALAVIDAQAEWLKQRSDLSITIVGRSDDGGNETSATDLAQRRAAIVRKRMVAGGVPASRIAIDVRGSKDPVALCKSAVCRAQNRHVETLISDSHSATTATLDDDAIRPQPSGNTRDPNER